MHSFYTVLLTCTVPLVGTAQVLPTTSVPPAPAAALPADTLQLQGQRQPVRPFLTIQDQLRTVAGVQVTPYDGSPGSGQVVRIRGASVVQAHSAPLYVVDGLPALNNELVPDQYLGSAAPLSPFASSTYYQPSLAEQYQASGASPLQLLPPESIASIEVLAGPAAVARYGPLGANGAISIRTRRGSSRAGQPLRVTYSAYGGVQQLRHRYDLLQAPEYAGLVTEYERSNGAPLSFPQLPTSAGTDWQAEAYRVAGLQQHQLSLGGQRGGTGFLISADYRQQAGILTGADLHRYGLRLALDQRVGARLTLRATAALGRTTQHLPYTAGSSGATQAALLAPPTAPVRTAQGTYTLADPASGLSFANPLFIADNYYRVPSTRRLLAQFSADYQLLPYLTAQVSANLERTLLDADSYNLPYYPYGQAPPPSQQYAAQTHRTQQWAATVALRYARRLGQHHQLGAELTYSQQDASASSETQYSFGSVVGNPSGGSYAFNVELQTLRRPWGRVFYRLDSTLTVEASLGYARFANTDYSQYYPAGQLSWRPHLALAGKALAPTLWLGAARTSALGFGFGYFGPVGLTLPVGSPFTAQRPQSGFYTDQQEAGLQLGNPAGVVSAQLVAYQRQSYHVLLTSQLFVSSGSGYTSFPVFDEGTIRNQGLELTLTANWAAGPVKGSTRLAASANRNRLQGDEYATQPGHFLGAGDNQPVGTFYGYQQQGLNADGSLHYAGAPTGSRNYGTQQALGNGIPGSLLSLSQQLGWNRLSLDAQLDALLNYQVVNYQRIGLDTPNGFYNNATTVRDRWTPTHQNTSIPALGTTDYSLSLSQYNYLTTSRTVEQAGNVRLSSLTVSYLLRRTATQTLTVWVGGQNLVVLTPYQGYDPNVSSAGNTPFLAGRDQGAVPVPRTWLLGVRAGF